MNTILNTLLEKLKHKIDEDRLDDNIGMSERALSVLSGGLILGMGIKSLWRHPITACTGLALGGALVYRGVTGHSSIKKIVDKVVDEDKVTVIEHRYFVK